MSTKSIPRQDSPFRVATVASEAHGERHRLFFALMPDAAVRAQIAKAAETLKSQHPLGRWILPERYHLTLHFIGEDPELRPERVGRAIAAARAVRAPTFELCVDSAASFPGSKPPWTLRCSEPAHALHELLHTLMAALAGDAAPRSPASEFIPHITVLRDADKALSPCAIQPFRWQVRDFALIDSQIGRQARYTELGRWSLAPEKGSKS
jgi:2'-5' RNA ligase